MAGTAPPNTCPLPESAGSGSALTVWGTGRPRRQFIYSRVGVGWRLALLPSVSWLWEGRSVREPGKGAGVQAEQSQVLPGSL